MSVVTARPCRDARVSDQYKVLQLIFVTFSIFRCFHRRRRFCGDACINIPDLNITSQAEPIPEQPQIAPQPESQTQWQPVYPQQPPLTPCQRNQMLMYPPQYIPQFVPQYVPQYIPQYLPQYIPQYTPQYAPQVIQQTHQPQIVQQQPQVIQQQPQVIQQQPQVIHIQPQIPPQIHQTITPCTKPGCGGQIQVQPQVVPVAPPCPQGCSNNLGYYGYQSPQNFYNYPSFDTYLTQ